MDKLIALAEKMNAPFMAVIVAVVAGIVIIYVNSRWAKNDERKRHYDNSKELEALRIKQLGPGKELVGSKPEGYNEA